MKNRKLRENESLRVCASRMLVRQGRRPPGAQRFETVAFRLLAERERQKKVGEAGRRLPRCVT
jgi:hypothetical protein